MKLRFPKISIRRWELKKVFIMLFAVLTIIPFIIVIALSYVETMASYRLLLQNAAMQTTETMNVKIEELFEDAISLLSIGSDKSTQAFLAASGQDQLYAAAKDMGILFENMRRVKHYNRNIYDVTIIGADGSCISERNGYYQLDREFADYETVKAMMNDLRGIHIFAVTDILSSSPMETNIMSVTTSIYRSGTNDFACIIKIDILKDEIHGILKSTQWSSSSIIDIVNDQGVSIFHNTYDGFSRQSIDRIMLEEDPAGSFSLAIDREKYQIFYNTLDSVPWKLVIGIPEQELRALYFRSDIAFLIIMPVCFLFVLLFIILILNQYIKPITNLRKLMEQASEGDLNIKADYDGNFEISELYKSFSSMVSKVDILMKSQVQDAANYRAIELKFLQAQINPHFLYNTLDSVIRVAEAGKTDDVIELIMALSQYYKAALSHGFDTVPIATVVKHIESYLTIMKMRFRDILDYSIEVDERALDATLPKLAIQPLVENAILHGIKNKRKGGKVTVEFKRDSPEMVSVTVKDDGIGMTEEKLAHIKATLQEVYTHPSESFGLKNINQRIKIFFGDKYGLDISSEYLKGTTVSVVVPFVKFVEGGMYV